MPPSYRILQVVALFCGLGLAGAAEAAPKKLAVLGLEIIDDGSNSVTVQKTADIAKLFTDRLRAEVEKTTAYRITPNSRKDLLELKLLSNCSDEAPTCMSEIGRELKTELILYGKLERRPTGYAIGLTLFSVAQQRVEKTATTVIPFKEALPGAIDLHVTRLYATIAGLSGSGTLVIGETLKALKALYILFFLIKLKTLEAI